MSSSLTYFFIKKLVYGVIVVLFVTILLFAILKSIPADPIEVMAGERVTGERLKELRAQWGLDKPVYLQYFYWLNNILHGNLGKSIVTKQPVSFLILSRLPYTLALMLSSLFLSYIVGIVLGIICVVKRYRLLDSIINNASTVLYSIPSFWLALMLIIVFAYKLGLFPISGYQGPESLVLPVLSLSIPWVARTVRVVRTELLEIISQDYIVTAIAKGLSPWRVILVHALRPALIAISALFFLDLPWVLGGSVIVETVFGYPGLGGLLYKAVTRLDYPVIMGIILLIAILTVISNTLGDIVVGIIDPRVRTRRMRS